MIETRDSEPVSEWLKSYPNLSVICRDGSITYKNAIETAHPEAVQVSDRFHLLKNLTEYGIEYLKGKLTQKVTIVMGAFDSANEEAKETSQIPTTACGSRSMTPEEKYAKIKEYQAMGYKKVAICKRIGIYVRTYEKILSMTPEERAAKSRTKAQAAHEENLRQKTELVAEVRDLHKIGMIRSEIARRKGLDSRTVTKYIDEKHSPVQVTYGTKRAGKLTRHIKEINSMLEAGLMNKIIYEKICQAGYAGSLTLVSNYISDWRKCRKYTHTALSENGHKLETLERKDVLRLLFHPLEQIGCIDQSVFDSLCRKFPCFEKIHTFVWEFRKILSDKNVHALQPWLARTRNENISEINSFVEGVTRDFDAVINAVKFDYSNGLAEGKINKLKLVKRIMYGRCRFSTLRTKVLLLDHPTFFNYLC
jgi:putative NADH-flavin reductase